MKLTVLGSGTSVPHPKRSSAGFWLETSSGSLLLDCSASAVHRMAQEHLDWANLDAIWISHFHLDHCGGLAPFLHGIRHAAGTRERTKPLTIFGGKGLTKLVSAFDAIANGKLLQQKFPVAVYEVGHLENFEILSGIAAVAMRTPHTDNSCALHLRDESGTTFVYTSDTGFDETIAAFARRVDLLLMECSFLKDKPIKTHLELSEAIYIIRKAAPRKTVLTHFFPDWDEFDLGEEVRKFSPDLEVIEAIDGLRLDVSE